MSDPRTAVVDAFNESQVDALRSVFGLGAGALAVGAGARGIAGLGSFLSRNLGGPPTTPMRQSFVRIPVPVEVRSKAERDAMLAAAAHDRDKEAGFAKLAVSLHGLASSLGLLRQPGDQPGLLHEQLAGWGQANPAQKPWFYPAAVAAGAGGLYGGWKLTDYLLDKTKDVEQESELEAARKEYEGALAGRRKIASAGGPLDALAELCEKRGLWDEAKGIGLTLAGLTALGSGLGAYNWTRSLSEDKAVEEAVKRRQAQIAEQAPSPIMAIPTPMPIVRPQDHRSHWHHLLGGGPEEDRRGEKAANIGRAADEFLGRIKGNQMAVWQRMMTPVDAKPAKPAAPAEPAPPQLPSVTRTLERTPAQPPAPAPR